MKGLLKYLSPFAPDQSGAVSVLFDLGGITVICDAGGCTGNICGFDEPRWFYGQSAIFSAGLRDMDAILGRDDRLVQKLKKASKQLDAEFISLIGTPVPTVIATDFKALSRMAEKRCDMPVIAVECTGTRLYDEGASEAYLSLFEKFAGESQNIVEERKSTTEENQGAADNSQNIVKGRIGVLGATVADTSYVKAGEKIRQAIETIEKEKRSEEEGKDLTQEVWVYGMGAGLKEIRQAATVEKNIVIAPSGLKAAQYLKKRFGTPYEFAYPILEEALKEKLQKLENKKVLIIHQQVAADEIRKEILKAGMPGKDKNSLDKDLTDSQNVVVASFFMMKPQLKQAQDVHLKTEEQFIELVREGQFDVIVGDGLLKRAIQDFKGQYIEVPHFAVSGALYPDEK